jgi:hypothetical protein
MPEHTRTEDVVVEGGVTYYHVAIRATEAETNIWIGDDHGHLVVKETGAIGTYLAPGDYTIEFGLGDATYPLALRTPVTLTEAEVRAGPPRQRAVFRFSE